MDLIHPNHISNPGVQQRKIQSGVSANLNRIMMVDSEQSEPSFVKLVQHTNEMI